MKHSLASLAQILAAQRRAFQPTTKRSKAAERRAVNNTPPQPDPLGGPAQK